MLPFGLRRLLGENLIEIERSVFGGVLKAERDLLVGQRRLGIRSVLGQKLTGAQSGLHRRAEFAADGGERLLVGVVEAEALAVARIERVESSVERVGEQCEVTRAMRIG